VNFGQVTHNLPEVVKEMLKTAKNLRTVRAWWPASKFGMCMNAFDSLAYKIYKYISLSSLIMDLKELHH